VPSIVKRAKKMVLANLLVFRDTIRQTGRVGESGSNDPILPGVRVVREGFTGRSLLELNVLAAR
jgi:hypothetical protein